VTPLARKLGIKAGARTRFLNAPVKVRKSVGDELQIASTLSGEFDYIHAFVKHEPELDKTFPKLKAHLKEGGAIWISWPKNRQLDTSLVLPKIIKIGYNHGLVESKTIGVDDTWSAIKFTWPKKGKIYKNSYGKLPASRTRRIPAPI
jgi:hypothetical protein